MKKTLLILLFYCLFISRLSQAQYPIFMPTSESSILSMHPGLTGMDNKSRFSLTQLYQSHPLGNVQSLNTCYEVDIPRLNFVTSLQLTGDRIGTKNQNLLFRWNIGYALYLSKKIRMLYSLNIGYATQSIDGTTFFNRFNYNDTLYSNILGTTYEKYFEQSLSCAIHSPHFFIGMRTTFNSPYLGQFNGTDIFYKLSTNMFFGLNLKTTFGTFKPFYGFTYQGSWAGNNSFLYDKFPSLSNHNLALNYQYKKWTTGIGMRTIKHHPNMYHVQVGIDLNKLKLVYSVGAIPYKNTSNESHIGVMSQVSLELNLKRSKHYYQPVFRTEIIEFPDHTTKVERSYKDEELYESIEYFENGYEKSIKNFENGLLNGYYSESNENGVILISGFYRKGLKNGSWTYYNDEGYKVKYEKYYMGDLIKSKTFQPN